MLSRGQCRRVGQHRVGVALCLLSLLPLPLLAAESMLAPPAPELQQGLPAAVTGHPDPLSLLLDADPALARNKQLVFDFWRGIVNSGQVERADEWMAEDYIQHSPALPTGRAAFKQIFSAIPRQDSMQELVSPPLATILAEDDLVVMALAEPVRMPDGSSYTTTHFNLFRVLEGRLVEHWHSVQGPPAAELPLPEDGGPQPVTGAQGLAQLQLLQAQDPQLAANKRLVFDAWRQLMDAGREELAVLYLAPDYIEHSPVLGSGRAHFMAQLAGRQDQPIATTLRQPVVALVAQGDLVVLVTGREFPHPHHSGRRYTTTWFDMFRITGGRIVEHWDGAMREGAPVFPQG